MNYNKRFTITEERKIKHMKRDRRMKQYLNIDFNSISPSNSIFEYYNSEYDDEIRRIIVNKWNYRKLNNRLNSGINTTQNYMEKKHKI